MKARSTWTLIRDAQGQGREARAAFDQLIIRYRGFLNALIRSRRWPPDQTYEDVTQDFLVQLVKDLPGVVQGPGSFRGWLTVAVGSHRSNTWKRWWAKRNIGSRTDFVEVEAATCETAEDVLLVTFARDTLRHAEMLQRGRTANPARFEILRKYLPLPDRDLEPMNVGARELGIDVGAVRKAICILRKEFKECLEEAIADTLGSDEPSPDGPDGPPGRPPSAEAIRRELSELRASLFPARSPNTIWQLAGKRPRKRKTNAGGAKPGRSAAQGLLALN